MHTQREKRRILEYAPLAEIIVHPIIWPSDYCITNDEQYRLKNVYEYLFKNDGQQTIGLFGFMSDYKNFLQVVRVALNEKKYRILLAGGVHPESSDYGKHIIIPKNKSDTISEFEIYL